MRVLDTFACRMCVWCLAVLLAAAPSEAGQAAEGAVEMIPKDIPTGSPPKAEPPENAIPGADGPGFRGPGGAVGIAPGGVPGGWPAWGYAPTGEGGDVMWRNLPSVAARRGSMYGVAPVPYHMGHHLPMAVVQLMPNMVMGGGKGGSGGVEGGGEDTSGGEMASQMGGVMGILEIQELGPHMFINGNITGLNAGTYGLFVHRSGDMRRGCDGLGMTDSFRPWYGTPILGDFGTIVAASDGTTPVRMMHPGIPLSGPHGALGRALVIRKVPDMGAPGSASPPMSPPAAACGVIAAM